MSQPFFFHYAIMISNMMAAVLEVIQYINHVKSMLDICFDVKNSIGPKAQILCIKYVFIHRTIKNDHFHA